MASLFLLPGVVQGEQQKGEFVRKHESFVFYHTIPAHSECVLLRFRHSAHVLDHQQFRPVCESHRDDDGCAGNHVALNRGSAEQREQQTGFACLRGRADGTLLDELCLRPVVRSGESSHGAVV